LTLQLLYHRGYREERDVVDVGDLYDEHVAAGYDREERGLLDGARSLALSQLRRHWAPDGPQAVLDLGVGTGEALLVVREHAPQARLHGLDVSGAMLAATLAKLPDVALVHDDVARVLDHHAGESADVVLLHFLTTYVDVTRTLADVASVLRPGGLLSLVSTTYEAFPVVGAAVAGVLGADELRRVNPAPDGGGELETLVVGAGLRVIESDTYEAEVCFEDVDELVQWGRESGFFTHVLAALAPEVLARLVATAAGSPISDVYRASAVLAVKDAAVIGPG
jgi:SAM-dependent methyltransferase